MSRSAKWELTQQSTLCSGDIDLSRRVPRPSRNVERRVQGDPAYWMESYEMDNIRSSATFVQCFCSSGTTMRLLTRPSTSSWRIQSR